MVTASLNNMGSLIDDISVGKLFQSLIILGMNEYL